MATPSQDLIKCKTCGKFDTPNKYKRLHCDACAKQILKEGQRRYRERLRQTPRITVCSKCGNEFDVSEQGRSWICPACNTKYMREYADSHKEQMAAYSRKYRATLADAYRERMVNRRKAMIEGMTQDELAAFRRKEADKSMRLNAELRETVFKAYGGYKCACCGETEPLFLTIDHVNNDGAEMRQNGTHSRGGTQFYQWLRKNNFPEGFQVLCMNCNLGKHRNGGVCPHKSGKV